MKFAYLAGVSLLALPSSVLAQAQSGAQGATATERQATSSNFEEIVVTAQRRAERLVDVPISVTAVSQDQLERAHVETLKDLSKVAAGIRFESVGIGVFSPTIRGVGSQAPGGGFDPAVGTYVDGIYVAGFADPSDLVNIENIQVLRGPQGTLFGRNATGGAIIITTAEPSFELKGRAKVSYGSYKDWRGEGYVSGPLSENIAVGISGLYRHTCGYWDNIVTGNGCEGKIRTAVIRPDILLTNNDNLKLRLIYQHSYYLNNSNQIYTSDGFSIGGFVPGAVLTNRFGKTANDWRPINKNKTDSASAHLEWNITDDLALNSYTGYSYGKGLNQQDLDMSSAPFIHATAPSITKAFTQEVTIGQKVGIIDWIAGVYYYDFKAISPKSFFLLLGSPFPRLTSKSPVESIAGFADVTVEATNGLFLTAGGRYNSEKKSYIFRPDAPADAPEQSASKRWNSFTYRAVARYEINSRTNIYASYSKGFKAGGFNAGALSLVPVRPEKITAYEAGFKTSNNSFNFNLSAFYYDYTDLQYTQFDTRSGTTQVTNAASQRSYGGEAELNAKITPEWSVGAGIAYLDAEYKSFPGAPGVERNASGLWTIFPIDAAGRDAIHSPKWTGTLNSSYAVDVGPGTVEIDGNVSFNSKFFHDAQNVFKEKAYALIDLNLGFTTKDQRWKFEVYGKNLTDKHYRTTANGNFVGTYQFWGWPRTFGGAVTLSF